MVVWDSRSTTVPLSNNPFHKGIPGIQSSNPNHEVTIPRESVVAKKSTRKEHVLELGPEMALPSLGEFRQKDEKIILNVCVCVWWVGGHGFLFEKWKG